MVEKETEHKLSQRLKIQYGVLKSNTMEHLKTIENEKKQLSTMRNSLSEQLERNNEKLRSALKILKNGQNEMLNKQEVESSNQTIEFIQQDTKQNEIELKNEIESLKSKLIEINKLKENAENELQQSLSIALEEYNSLDTFAKQVQEQFDGMHEWYKCFEEWSKDSCCDSCGYKINAIEKVEKIMVSKRQN